MSNLIYNHATKRIELRDKNGVTIGRWPANNNVASKVGLPSLPNGVYRVQDNESPHRHASGDSSNGPYGPAGIVRLADFHFKTDVHTGVGIHSGRKHHRDGLGRKGVDHATLLCIRTSDEAMSMITMTMRRDPLESLIVEQSAIKYGFVKSGQLNPTSEAS